MREFRQVDSNKAVEKEEFVNKKEICNRILASFKRRLEMLRAGNKYNFKHNVYLKTSDSTAMMESY